MKELIEKLEKLKESYKTHYASEAIGYREGINDAIKLVKSELQALSQSEWISVEDRLPDDREWYQVSNGKGVYIIPHTYRENEGWLDYDGFPTKARITHYRLLDLTPPQTK